MRDAVGQAKGNSGERRGTLRPFEQPNGNQKSIESEFDTNYNLPVLYLTQILGLAMGFDRKELGLNMNIVKTKELLSKYFPKE